jgi:hypothetical protein
MSRHGQVSPHGRWGHTRSYRRDQVSRRWRAVTASLLSLLSLLSPRVASSRAILPEFLCRHHPWASHIRLVVTGPKQEEEETIASASQRPLPGFPPHPTHPPFPITIVIGGCTTNRSPPSFTARRMVLLLLYPAVRHSAGREAGGGAVELLGGRPRTGTGVDSRASYCGESARPRPFTWYPSCTTSLFPSHATTAWIGIELPPSPGGSVEATAVEDGK